MPSEIGPGPAVLAVDVGGTNLYAGLFDTAGRAVGVHTQPAIASTDGTATALVAQIREVFSLLTSQNPDVAPEWLAVSVPGVVNESEGMGVFSANLGWRLAPIKEMLQREFAPLSIAFGHDVRSACLAEHRLGAAKDTQNAFILTIGTGIAGGIIADGRLVASEGYAGEFGHATVDPAGPVCACGARGCLEEIASAGALARHYEKRTEEKIAGARELRARADAGDAVALELWDEAIAALALILAQSTAILAPEVVVIGGGLSQAGTALFSPLEDRLAQLLSFHRVPKIVPAELLDDAGLVGAALHTRLSPEESYFL